MAAVGYRQRSTDRTSMEEDDTSSYGDRSTFLLDRSTKDRSSQSDASMLPPPRPEQTHPRPVSFTSRPGNRLSLSLPIQAGDKDMRHTPTSSDPSSTQGSPSMELVPTLASNESSAFLVALAAQERKVLEVKEELYRAEKELNKLKRQWASHEAGRNTGRSGVEMSQLEMRQMSPIIQGVENSSADEADDHSVKREIEAHRRKAILAGISKDSRRKVISGGHTRALSLLSPVRSVHGGGALLSTSDSVAEGHAGSNGLPQYFQVPSKVNSNKTRHSYQGGATIGVKQIADDIKSGLWTFMEDLKQATVGDEAIKGSSAVSVDSISAGPGKNGNTRIPMKTDENLDQIDAESKSTARGRESIRNKVTTLSYLEESNNRSEPIAQAMGVNENRPDNAKSMDGDWSNWDSPFLKGNSGRWSNSTALSSQDSSILSSPLRESRGLSTFPKRDETQWSVLSSFTPSSIKRTASAIIKDWEKSLTAPIDGGKEPTNSVSDSTKKTIEDLESQLPSCAHP